MRNDTGSIRLGRWFAILLVVAAGAYVALVFVGSKAIAQACSGSGSAFAATASDAGAGVAPDNADLLTSIRTASAGNARLALPLLMGTYLESNRDPKLRSNDGATGAYQIQDAGVRPGPNPDITVQQTLDPAYATNYMLPRYKAALRAENPQMWLLDPMMAGHNVAYHAERPIGPYIDYQGAARVNTAYTTSITIMKSWGMDVTFRGKPVVSAQPTPSPSTSAPTPTPTSPGSSPLSAISETCDPYKDLSFTNDAAQKAIKAAQKYLGTPVVYGGGDQNGPSTSTAPGADPSVVGFDDGSLAMYAYHQAGATIPRTAVAQFAAYSKSYRALGQEQPGDLVFFSGTSNSRTPDHVGIVVDPSTFSMIEAPLSGGTVMYSNYKEVKYLLKFVHILPDSSPTGKYVRERIGSMGLYNKQCGEYVGYVVHHLIPGFPARSIGYYGKDFANNLGGFGYTVSNRPSLHAVVSFPISLSDPNGVAGHVALVSGFNADGSIEVEEFNWGDHPMSYGTHIVPRSIVNKLTYADTGKNMDLSRR